MNNASPLIMGAVAYDPKVVTIWDGFQQYFRSRGLEFDYVLYSNYERQVEAQLCGQIQVAWNSPLAWLETERAAARTGRRAEALCMRDTDRGLTSIILVRSGSAIASVADLRGRTVAVGANDSPQATLIPLHYLAEQGLRPHDDFRVLAFDVLAGKHGDHIGGERDAVLALVHGEADAACILDSNHLAFGREGTIPSGAARVLAQTPPYDHCNFTALDGVAAERVARFRDHLLAMSYGDAQVRPLLDLEGLKQWVPGRVTGYAQLAAAVDRFQTIDPFVKDVLVRCGVDLGPLAFAEGGYLLVKRALGASRPGDAITVTGTAPRLDMDLRAWARVEGHRFEWHPGSGAAGGHAIIVNGGAHAGRWTGAERVAREDGSADSPAEHPPRRWGLAARGATIEAGTPEFDFHLVDKIEVWSDDAAWIYAQAAAAQWDPETAIPWNAAVDLAADVEDAVVQIMTYLIENETAALIIPSRFIAQLHPHFREVMQVLAVQAADEARHIEIFTRRARLKRAQLGLSTIGGQASLKTLMDEPDFAIASFLLSVLGEGTFLSLLWFIERHAPDPVTAAVARLAAQDEARHVAFGLAHLGQHLGRDATLRPRLAEAIRRRHDALRQTAGLNEEVFDALLLMAAGTWEHARLQEGHRRVMQLTRDMDEGRRKRLVRLGFADADAAELSALHTRNFM